MNAREANWSIGGLSRRSIFLMALAAFIACLSQTKFIGQTPSALANEGGIAGSGNPYTWAAIGSSGSPDDSDVKKVAFTGTYATVRSSGEVVLRYNIEGFPPTDADGAQLWVRMRDDGSDARVHIRFKRASILNGDTETIASYDSNDLPPSNKYELDSVDICGFEWDFYNFVYYVEARLQRDSSEGHPGLAAIQISELYCE